MATFTMELWEVLELDPTIEAGILAGYPIFDEAHRAVLNRKILKHFHNREIGQETVSMFRLALARKLDEIMPLYNQQYEISAINFNQLETIRINNSNVTANNTVSAGESESTSTSGSKARAVAQELPQTLLSGNGDYATNAQDTISDTTTGGTGTDSSTVNQDGTAENTTTGFQGNAALMILQYRQSLVNVDMMIIDELQNLFMGVWGNGDDLTARPGITGYFGFGRFIY